MSKKLVWVPVLVAVLLPFAAHALGLGEIKLNSALNQPLSADIPVVGASPAELGSLQVKVASAQQFQQAGIPMPAVLGTLQFQIVKQPNGGANIHISSNQPVREPFLDFLLDATWNNGELLREYTVFVNPPNFESTTQAPAPVPAPVQQPTAPVAVPAPVPAKPVAPVAAPVSPAPVAPPVSPAPATPAAPAAGGNYGPIHRGETLSEIALKLRPQGVSLNQMMIAIYRANGKVFAHNINVMRAGYVLRLPSMNDIQAVGMAEANSEVRTQVEAWRASRGLAVTHKAPKPVPSTPVAAPATPALQLVAPGSAAQTPENALPGAGKGGQGETATAPAAKPAVTETTAGKTPESHAPIEVKNGGLAAVQQQAAETNKQPTPAPVMPAPKPEPKPLEKPVRKPAVQPAPAASGSILDTLESPYAIAIILIVIVVVLIGVAIKMRKKGGAAAPSPFKTGKTGKIKSSRKEPAANWEKKEASGLEDTLTQAAVDKKEPEAAADEFSGGTQAMLSPMAAAEATAGKGAAKLDESDPKAEADFHMAYGLYDQAAETLKKALKQEPGRRDLRMKLLEVYFTAGDRANFVQAARELQQEVGGKADKDWETVAIMGRQIAPDETLFKSTGTSTGTSTGVDIALDSGAPGTTSATDLDPLAGAFAGIGGPVTAPAPVAAAPAPALADNAMDFNLPDIEPLPLKAAPKAEKPAEAPAPQKPAAAPGTMDFDLGGLDMEPATPKQKPAKKEEPTVTADFGTDSQVEFDKALKELADFVNTNVPPQEEAAKPQPTGLSLDAEPPPSAEDAGEATLGVNEVGTKLDLARAYIDMGDSEGARNILEEVLHEGDAQQKQHAQQLMKHLG